MTKKRHYWILGLIAASVVCVYGVFAGQASRQSRSPEEDKEWTFIYDWLSRPKKSHKPSGGFVPDARTASAIGEAVASALYGDDSAGRQKPFRADLRGGVWTVMGTPNPSGAYGGVAVIQIRKEDGRVVFAIHTH
jgi:hypothetical protein